MFHKIILFLFLQICLSTNFQILNAQETFSIIAVDTVTGEIGSAGASCLDLFNLPYDTDLIADVIPGIGAIAGLVLLVRGLVEFKDTILSLIGAADGAATNTSLAQGARLGLLERHGERLQVHSHRRHRDAGDKTKRASNFCKSYRHSKRA